jgi:hypothetical protein
MARANWLAGGRALPTIAGQIGAVVVLNQPSNGVINSVAGYVVKRNQKT